MMATVIRENSVTPEGDDPQWKAEELRVQREVIAAIQALQSQVTTLQGRVN